MLVLVSVGANNCRTRVLRGNRTSYLNEILEFPCRCVGGGRHVVGLTTMEITIRTGI